MVLTKNHEDRSLFFYLGIRRHTAFVSHERDFETSGPSLTKDPRSHPFQFKTCNEILVQSPFYLLFILCEPRGKNLICIQNSLVGPTMQRPKPKVCFNENQKRTTIFFPIYLPTINIFLLTKSRDLRLSGKFGH